MAAFERFESLARPANRLGNRTRHAYTLGVAEGGATSRASIHCVLWHAPDAPPTPELTSLLVQRGVSLETASNPYAAAAKVCRLERTARARRRPEADATDAPPAPADAPSLVLLLCEPARLPLRDALARVLELHAPRTLCWVYEKTTGPKVRTIPLAQIGTLGSPTPAPVPAPIPPPAPGRSAHVAPTMRLTSTEPSPRLVPGDRDPDSPGPSASLQPSPRAEPKPAQAPINTGSVLTDEELAMLLSDVDDPQPRRGRTTPQDPPRSHRP